MYHSKLKSKNIFIIILAVLAFGNGYGQTDSGGSITLLKDARIDQLIKKQSQINRVSVFKNSRGEYKGYRVMVLSTNNRDLAYKSRADMLRNYPDQHVYMAYQSPYYKIKVGDYLKREDAEKMKKEMMKVFKVGVYVVSDIIRLKPEDEARLMSEEEKR